MKRSYLSLISFITVCLIMLCAFVACKANENLSENTTQTETRKSESLSSAESESLNSESAESSEDKTESEAQSSAESSNSESAESSEDKRESEAQSSAESLNSESAESSEDKTESEAHSSAESESFDTETSESKPSDITTESDSEYCTDLESSAPEFLESETAEYETESETDKPILSLIDGEYADIIENADRLKNLVTAYYTGGKRSAFRVVNNHMVFDYTLTAEKDQLATVSTPDGRVYVSDTMDVYVKMDNGKTYYASGSTSPATANLFRYGYYYYDAHMYDQSFVNNVITTKETKIKLSLFKNYVDVTEPETANGALSFAVTSTDDPYISAKVGFSTEEHNAVRVTMRTESSTSLTLYIAAGSYKGANEQQRVNIPLISDGEYHTYTLPIGGLEDYTGDVTLLRLDLNGATVGENVLISEIKAVQLENDGAPALRLDRNLHTFADKANHIVRIIAEEDVSGILELGMVTKIAADTVSKLVVKDKNGLHNNLYEVDFASAEYVGFDIKGVGIFGYILLDHENSGKITVSLEGENYVITQISTPANGIVKAPVTVEAGDEIIKNYPSDSLSIYKSGTDHYFGQRIYTDLYHSFNRFIAVAEVERNPLSAENITVDESDHQATYDGYDPIRGVYCFTSKKHQGFNGAFYQTPNEHNGVSFTVTGDDRERNMYVLVYAYTTGLECAAVLDKNDMMLPIPVEVAKNFGHEFEVPVYSWGDIKYSEAYLPILLNANESKTMTVLHLYQNWGKYPLKQLSSIQYYSPYYHLSTGCTETNCIATHYVHGKDLWTLPDHRAMSAPLWSNDPQHTSGGNHYFLQYTDADGNYSASENVLNIIESAGPTYADVNMTYLSDDGRIKVTYSHMEMPQTDENRTYYEIKYEVLEDISFKDFSRDFSFYSAKGYGDYKKIGYLDENNTSAIRDNNATADTVTYVLGNDHPYFDMFQITDGPHGDESHPDYTNGYVNLSFLIYDSDFTIGGKQSDARFVINNQYNTLSLSLDLEEVTLKAGDSFSINAIIMPWGSQETDYTSDVPDKNVRDVRMNSIIDPAKPSAVKYCEVVDSVFMPKIKSTNGSSAVFTLSGGEGNVTFRVYGFEKLTVPELYEKINGEWKLLDVSSLTTPDSAGNCHPYDGYCVHYDGDGTYSYSFVTTMTDSAERSFWLKVQEDFVEWPDVEDMINVNLMLPADRLNTLVSSDGKGFGRHELAEDNSYVRFFGDSSGNPMDSRVTVGIESGKVTGQYVALKYRVYAADGDSRFSVNYFTSTQDPSPTGNGDNLAEDVIADGEWHVLIVDLGKYGLSTFTPDNGVYRAKFIRLDVLNHITSKNSYIDIAYLAMSDDLLKLCLMNRDIEKLDYVETKGIRQVLLSASGEIEEPEIENVTSPNDVYAEDLNVYISPVKIFQTANGSKGVGSLELCEENAYVRIFGNNESDEAYAIVYSGGETVSGKYFVIKYRIPTTNSATSKVFDIFSSTVNSSPKGTDVAQTRDVIADGEWHLLVIDITTFATSTTFTPADDGTYTAKYMRFDFFEGKMSLDSYIDIAFIGICEDPTAILEKAK